MAVITPLESDPDKTVLGSIRGRMDSFSASDRRVATWILENPIEVVQMTVSQLSERAGVAESTIVRCAKRLGYSGFQDLKIHLARESAVRSSSASPTLSRDASAAETLVAVAAVHRETLSDMSSSIAGGDFEAAVDLLQAADRVVLIGFGSSAMVCNEAEERLFSLGVNTSAPRTSNMKYLACSRMTDGDVLVCVSHTGATKDIINYARMANAAGAKVLAITSLSRTQLENAADITLVAGGRELDFEFGSLSGRIAHLSVVDALYVSLAVRQGRDGSTNLVQFEDIESGWRI